MRHILFILMLIPFIGNSQMIINSYAFGGGGDVTPNPIDWPDVIFTSPEGTSETKTITGITSSITISLFIIANEGNILYSKNGASFTPYLAPFSVSNNDTLAFKVTNFGPGFYAEFQVVNDSDNSAVIDAIFFYRYDEPAMD